MGSSCRREDQAIQRTRENQVRLFASSPPADLRHIRVVRGVVGAENRGAVVHRSRRLEVLAGELPNESLEFEREECHQCIGCRCLALVGDGVDV